MKNLFIVFILIMALAKGLHAQGLTIGSGTTFSLGSATLYLPNNWSNSGTFNAENGTVVLNGSSGNQTISNYSGEIFNNLIVDKSSGDVQLLDSILVTENLTLINGDLDINDKVLRLGSNALFNETPGNTLKGGIAFCTKNLNAPTSVNILGAIITSPADLGITTVERGHTEQDVDGNPSILRYYDITPTNNTSLDATLSIYYDDSELNGLDEEELGIYWYNPVSSLWENKGAVCDKFNNYCTVYIEHFSRWTLAELSDGIDSLYLNALWNLVSVPRVQSNDTATAVFPDLYGSMYEFVQGSGYYPVITLMLGKGYWLYYQTADTVAISGSVPGSIVLNAKAGWNIIGSRDSTIQVSALVLSGGATIMGDVVYLFVPGSGYVPVDAIKPGEGAWVYISADCTITF